MFRGGGARLGQVEDRNALAEIARLSEIAGQRDHSLR